MEEHNLHIHWSDEFASKKLRREVAMMRYMNTYVKKIILFCLLLSVLLISGCGIPDLPGPIGIPGI
jgi:hypothetical protein